MGTRDQDTSTAPDKGGRQQSQPPSQHAGADAQELFTLVYDELRAMAAKRLLHERSGHTLQPTALVHEVYMRLAEQKRVDWRGRTHFLAVAAQAMRRVLIDHARADQAAKRGGKWRRVTLTGVGGDSGDAAQNVVNALALHDALANLASLDERQARVAEARLYAGMAIADIASALGVSERTVKNDWRVARAWLAARLRESGGFGG